MTDKSNIECLKFYYNFGSMRQIRKNGLEKFEKAILNPKSSFMMHDKDEYITKT